MIDTEPVELLVDNGSLQSPISWRELADSVSHPIFGSSSRRQFLGTVFGTAVVVGIALLNHACSPRIPLLSYAGPVVSGSITEVRQPTPVTETAQRLMSTPRLRAWRYGLPEGYSVTIASCDPFLREFQETSFTLDDKGEAKGSYTRILPSDEADRAEQGFWVQSARHVFVNGFIHVKDASGLERNSFLSIVQLERPIDFEAEPGTPGSEPEIVPLGRFLFANMTNFESRRFVDQDLNTVQLTNDQVNQLNAGDINWPKPAGL